MQTLRKRKIILSESKPATLSKYSDLTKNSPLNLKTTLIPSSLWFRLSPSSIGIKEMDSPRGLESTSWTQSIKAEIPQTPQYILILAWDVLPCNLSIRCVQYDKLLPLLVLKLSEITAQSARGSPIEAPYFPLPLSQSVTSLAGSHWYIKKIGLQKLVRSTGLLSGSPHSNGNRFHQSCSYAFRYQLTIIPAQGEKLSSGDDFRLCATAIFFSPVNEATVRVLRTANGCEVTFRKNSRLLCQPEHQAT